MTLQKVFQRLWTFELEDPNTPGTFVEIGGLNNVTDDPVKNDADTTTFDSDGWLEHLPASRGRGFTITGLRIEDTGDASRDPGQALAEDMAALVGTAGLTTWRVTTPGGTVISALASVDTGEKGGGNDDPTAFSATVVFTGPLTVV